MWHKQNVQYELFECKFHKIWKCINGWFMIDGRLSDANLLAAFVQSLIKLTQD